MASKNITTRTTIQNLVEELKGTFARKTDLPTKVSDLTNDAKYQTEAQVNAAVRSGAYDDSALAGRVAAAEGKLTALVGSDANKSARTIANEELAAQLIPENAKESLDTLGEIAAWIQSHPDDASAMNSAITALQTKLTLGVDGGGKEYASVKLYVEAAIAALQIGDYAKAADLTALAGRVTALEGKATKVEASSTNGHITINGTDTTVYTLPSTTLDESDIVDYTAAEDLPTLSFPGYVFVGWCEDAARAKVILSGWPVTTDATLYAKWCAPKRVQERRLVDGELTIIHRETGARDVALDDGRTLETALAAMEARIAALEG